MPPQHLLQPCVARSQYVVLEITELSRHVTLQALYSYTTTSSAANAPADRPAAAAALSMMSELHVEGFDAEQIWLQLDMASAQLVRRAKRLLKKAGSEPSLLTPETEEDLSGQHAAFHGVQQQPWKCYPVYPVCGCAWVCQTYSEHLGNGSYSSSQEVACMNPHQRCVADGVLARQQLLRSKPI